MAWRQVQPLSSPNVSPAGPRVTKIEPTESSSHLPGRRVGSEAGSKAQHRCLHAYYTVGRHIGMQPGCSNLRWWRCEGCCCYM